MCVLCHTRIQRKKNSGYNPTLGPLQKGLWERRFFPQGLSHAISLIPPSPENNHKSQLHTASTSTELETHSVTLTGLGSVVLENRHTFCNRLQIWKLTHSTVFWVKAQNCRMQWLFRLQSHTQARRRNHTPPPFLPDLKAKNNYTRPSLGLH